jgi:glycosyltransferase involved in cell wall biosynthesis
MKKVIFSIPNVQTGGAERFFCTLYNNFSSENCVKKLVLGKKEGGLLSSLNDKKNVIELGSINSRKSIFRALVMINKEKPDVMICTLGFVILYSIIRILPFTHKFTLISRIGNSLSVDQLNSKYFFIRKIKYYINYLPFIASDLVIAQSHSMKNDFISIFGPKVEKKIIVIHNGLDLAKIDLLSNEQSEVHVDPSKINFILLGRLFPQKGYDILINAVALLPKELNLKIEFNICGQGPLKTQLEKQVTELNVSNVKFMGEIMNPYSFIKENDCLILPSRYEGFSNTLIEAQLLGLPAIVSNSPGGNIEVIDDDKLGLVFENLNAKALADAIQQYVKNVNQYDAKFITKRTIERYSIKNIAKQYANLLLRCK